MDFRILNGNSGRWGYLTCNGSIVVWEGMIYRPRKRRPDAYAIGTIIDSVLGKCRPGTGEAFARIWEIWDEVVGSAIAAQARPAAFKNGELLVHATNSVWLQQLQFLRQEILRKLNARCGDPFIRELKFKIGSL
jgi:hypothetical protein